MHLPTRRAEQGAASIPALVAAAVRRSPYAVAIEVDSGAISYAELVLRAALLAGALRAGGVTPGTVVAICLPRSIDQLVALLAVWKAGAAYLPLDPAWPDTRQESLIARAGCAAVVATTARGTAIAGPTPVIDPSAVQPRSPDEVPTLSDLAYVIYTSGSTGTPKAVEVTHGNLAALIEWHGDAFAVSEGIRSAHLAGLGFDAAAWDVWPTLAAGGTLCLAGEDVRRDPAQLRDWLVAQRIEVAFAPTALAEPLVRMDWPADTRLRVLLTGADRLTVRPQPGLPFDFVNNYGPTECTVVATSGIVTPTGSGLPSIGRPVGTTTIHLLDPEGVEVSLGTSGEIHIGGAQVARGYHGDPALTAARFIVHPEHGRLYRTGDIGAWLDNGELAFLGRLDDQVKLRGHRIEPAEVSAALATLDVLSNHVLVRDGELVAYIVPAPGGAPNAAALRDALALILPAVMIPSRFAQLDALPLTANGKIDVAALPDPATCALAEAGTTRAPSTPTEKRVYAIVSDVLGHGDFGVDDDFFLIGGHSLLGTQVIVRAREAFGVELSLLNLFEAPTVVKLSQVIETLIFAAIAAMSDDEIRRMTA